MEIIFFAHVSSLKFFHKRILNDNNQFVKPQDRNIGFVFQDYPLFPHLNLKDNILFNIDNNTGCFFMGFTGLVSYSIDPSIRPDLSFFSLLLN